MVWVRLINLSIRPCGLRVSVRGRLIYISMSTGGIKIRVRVTVKLSG